MAMYSYSQNRHADPADISQNLEQRLNDLHVKAASAKAQQGLHGKGTDACVDCEEPIDEKRKELLPGATRCADCQEAHERLESMPGYGRDM